MVQSHHRLVLLATDSAERARCVEDALAHSRGAIELLWGTIELRTSDNLRDVAKRLESRLYDVVLLDPSLGVREGNDPLNTILIASPRTAVVAMVSEQEDGAALDILRRGAQDYIMAEEIDYRSLTRVLHGAAERKSTEMAIAESRAELIWRLAKAAEYRDNETGNHVVRVGCYAREIGIALGLSRNEIETIFLAAPLHDIGKISIPDAILKKPGRLTDEEMRVMQQHCAIGARILDDSTDASQSQYAKRVISSGCLGVHDDPVRSMARRIAMSHHERWDGTGYPGRLAGDRIPLEARIVALCDVFDALLSPRPYKRAFDLNKCLEIIRKGRGNHFDPAVSDAFERCLPTIMEIRADLVDTQEEEAKDCIEWSYV